MTLTVVGTAWPFSRSHTKPRRALTRPRSDSRSRGTAQQSLQPHERKQMMGRTLLLAAALLGRTTGRGAERTCRAQRDLHRPGVHRWQELLVRGRLERAHRYRVRHQLRLRLQLQLPCPGRGRPRMERSGLSHHGAAGTGQPEFASTLNSTLETGTVRFFGSYHFLPGQFTPL